MEALEEAQVGVSDIELVAVTNRPGLPGCLLVGMAFAKAVSYSLDIPLIGVDHVQAHIISAFIDASAKMRGPDDFPFLGLVVSGGHTSIYRCDRYDSFELIGRTKDDAVGEAFDKVSKIMALGYPGGPVIEKKAESYTGKDEIGFPKALLCADNSLDFSFSGIKTAVLYYWRKCAGTEEDKVKISYSFQEAVTDTITAKVRRALKKTAIDVVAAGGGVINNKVLRKKLFNLTAEMGIDLFLPEKDYCMDNAGMIAVTGEILFNMGYRSDLQLKAVP
jgi:N6-L-threonylcarbamoyladenine synthase